MLSHPYTTYSHRRSFCAIKLKMDSNRFGLHSYNHRQTCRRSCREQTSFVTNLSARANTITCHRHSHLQHRRPLNFPLEAHAASGALNEEPSLGAALKRRLKHLQQNISSPYDNEILSIAFPALIGLALEPVVNALSMGLVGHLGTQQLSAVSLGATIINTSSFLFSFLLFLTVSEIAAAVVKDDKDEVSQVAAQSLWVALGCGVLMAAVVSCNAATIVAALKPPDPAVAALATTFIQIRALGIPTALLAFVANAVFRGCKDTRTPLLGTGVSVAASFLLHMLLLKVFHLGVYGAALAATAASFAGLTSLMALLLSGGKVQVRHLASPPPLAVVLPLLQRGLVLGGKNVVAFGMILFASTLCVRGGAAFQASFEVIRQFWSLSMPAFECMGIATQTLCAAAIGQQDTQTARSLLDRLLFLGMSVGALAAVAVWAVHEPVVAFFTKDAQVVAHVMQSLPLVVFFFPIDAAASIMDGSLLAAKQSNYMSAVQIAGSAVQYLAFIYIMSSGSVGTLSIWATIKIMTLVRTLGGFTRNFYSTRSAYRPGLPHTSKDPTDSLVSTSTTNDDTAATTPNDMATATANGTVPSPNTTQQQPLSARAPLPSLPPSASSILPHPGFFPGGK